MPQFTYRNVGALILCAAAATILGALVFEHGFGLHPCPLCLMQRKPFYGGIALALAMMILPLPARWLRWGLLVLGALFLASAGLGAYHAGVEWSWWLGPSDCSAPGGAAPADMGAFLDTLSRTRVVSCTEAAWRFLGLSLAGWNVLISLAIAALALAGAIFAHPKRGVDGVV